MTSSAEQLWTHPDPTSTPMWAFLRSVNDRHGLDLRDYPGLYRWSVDNVAAFWGDIWDFVGVNASRGYGEVLPPDAQMFPRPPFMESARLNFAQNLLFPPAGPCSPPPLPTSPAVISLDETASTPVVTTWADLRAQVGRLSRSFRASGLRRGDVVAGLTANHTQALTAMLAAAAVGALWTGLSPDTGCSAVLDRWGQIGPRILVLDDGAIYNGKRWAAGSKAVEVVAALKGNLKAVVVVTVLGEPPGLESIAREGVDVAEWGAYVNRYPENKPLEFEQLPPSHPLYVLYSSGTTGLPKAIVHTALGTLLQHKKEHLLHSSMTASSRLLYYTTTSWMMWHWSVSALAVGATVILYSGSPFKPYGFLSMPNIISDHRVTHFGTSAAYLATLEANNVSLRRDVSSSSPPPPPPLDLSSLETIFSTASPLPPSTFRWVYSVFPPRVNLASITGGTDIISLFGAPCPLLPVRAGEIQCAGLGMAIRAVDPATGEEVPAGEEGDLVCVKPFPAQPLTFFGAGGEDKYRAAYFERFSDVAGGARGPVWHHGDFVRIPDPATGGLVMLGRSDGVLKPAGVRFGSAEIYNVLAKFFATEVEDAVCVGRRRERDRDETVCLFVVLRDGGRVLDEALKGRIKATIRTELSPRHVPGVVEVAGGGIPKTGNGKKIEVAVKQIVSGLKVKTIASVANPESLEWFAEWEKQFQS